MPQPAYVNSGAEHRITVSSNAVSGLTLPMPASLVVGNFLIAAVQFRPSGTTPSSTFNDDTVVVTGSGVWTQLFDSGIGLAGGHVIGFGKHVTGGEGNLSVLVQAVGVGGNGIGIGAVHQFSNVKFTGDTSYFEALHVTEVGAVSGPLTDAAVQTTGPDRLAVNVQGMLAGAGETVSVGPTGETGGKWVNKWYSTGGAPNMALWTATMSVAGTIDGGAVTRGPAGVNRRTAVGFAFAPCGANVSVPKFHHYLMMANG